MGPVEYIRSLFDSGVQATAADTKPTITGKTVNLRKTGDIFYMDRILANLVLDHPICWTCIDRNSGIVSSTPLRYKNVNERGDILSKINNGFIPELLVEPFPGISLRETIRKIVTNIDVYGEAVAYIDRNRDGAPRKIEIIEFGFYNKFLRKDRSLGWEVTFADGVKRKVDYSQILHFRGPFYGFLIENEPCPPVNYAVNFAIKRDGIAKERIVTELTRTLEHFMTSVEDNEKRKQLAQSYRDIIKKTKNRSMFWPAKKVSDVKFAEPADQFAYIISKLNVFEICIVYGWTPQLLGFSWGDSGPQGRTLTEALILLSKLNIDIKMSLIEQEMYLKLVSRDDRMKQNTAFKFDDSPFRLSVLERADVVKSLRTDAGLISTDEGRNAMGYENHPDTEIGKTTIIPAGSPGANTPTEGETNTESGDM